MFRARFVGSLATFQLMLLLGAGFLHLAGHAIPWALVLLPLWTLFGIAVLFWGVLVAATKAFGR